MRKFIPLSLLLILLAAATSVCGNDTMPQVRLLASNPAPFVGEEIVLALEVRSAGRPGTIALRWPDLAPFAAVELPFPPPRRESEGTTTWLVQRAEKALIPLAPGTFTLTGAGVQRGGTFIPAPPTSVRARALPAAGRPANFAGAVGEVAMTLAAGGRGSREIILTLHGHAPLDAFPLPAPHLGPGERLVPLSDSVSGEAPGERVRTLRYLYLPGAGRNGELRFTLPTFQPQKQRYEIVAADIGSRRSHLFWVAAALLLFLAAATVWRWRRRLLRPRSLAEVLTRLCGRPIDGLSRLQITTALRQRGIAAPLIKELCHHWSAEDAKRFAPGVSPTRPQERGAAAGLARRLRKAVDKWPRIS
jgi:hypothetical protein